MEWSRAVTKWILYHRVQIKYPLPQKSPDFLQIEQFFMCLFNFFIE